MKIRALLSSLLSSRLSSLLLPLLFSLILPIQAFAYPLMPNPETTPGSLCTRQHSDYAGDRYKAKIPYCRRNVESELKTELYLAYGVPLECRGRYTIDHLIPLSIGGDNSSQNLWPEHRLVKATRPYLEQEVFEALRDGFITQEQAVQKIYHEKMQARQWISESAAASGDDCDR